MSGVPGGGRLVIGLTDPSALPAWKSCVATLQAAGHLVRPVDGIARIARDFAEAECEVAVMVVVPGREAQRRISDLLAKVPDLVPVVLVGAAGRDLILAGAWMAVADPLDAPRLESAVARALRHCRALRREARVDESEPLSRLLGVSEEIAEVERLAARAAITPAPVLVVGEPGSGKLVVAHAVHAHPKSPRRSGPFVKCLVNGMEPAHMQEELYGTAARPGPYERAHGGSLFVDDVTLLPPLDQTRLIGMLEKGPGATVTRHDGSAAVPTDFRLIAGTSTPVEELPQRGRLIEDLYYRISVLPIRIPPLRRRVGDIPVLAGTSIDRYAAGAGRTVVGLSPRAVAILQRYHWPGNIRELEEHVERAVRRATGAIIEADDLAELAHMTAGRPDLAPTGTLDIALSLAESLALTEVARRAAVAAEVAAIRRALKLTGGNVTHAARLLQVSRLHLQTRMKKYGLREPK